MSIAIVTFCSDPLLRIKEYRDYVVGDVEDDVKGDMAGDLILSRHHAC